VIRGVVDSDCVAGTRSGRRGLSLGFKKAWKESATTSRWLDRWGWGQELASTRMVAWLMWRWEPDQLTYVSGKWLSWAGIVVHVASLWGPTTRPKPLLCFETRGAVTVDGVKKQRQATNWRGKDNDKHTLAPFYSREMEEWTIFERRTWFIQFSWRWERIWKERYMDTTSE
jgi:hypothetical protein